jgi:hypothetical protein
LRAIKKGEVDERFFPRAEKPLIKPPKTDKSHVVASHSEETSRGQLDFLLLPSGDPRRISHQVPGRFQVMRGGLCGAG